MINAYHLSPSINYCFIFIQGPPGPPGPMGNPGSSGAAVSR